MFKMLIGNVLFFGIIACWYLYTDGDKGLVLAGTIMAFSCFICGIVMGYVLHTPPKRRKSQVNVTTAAAFISVEPVGSAIHAAEANDGEDLSAKHEGHAEKDNSESTEACEFEAVEQTEHGEFPGDKSDSAADLESEGQLIAIVETSDQGGEDRTEVASPEVSDSSHARVVDGV